VRLQYDLSLVPKELCRDGLTDWFRQREDAWRFRKTLRDRPVFAQVRLDRDNVAKLVALTDRRPAGEIHLQGRVDSVNDADVRVRYGVEALFTHQGGAKAFEAKARGEMAGVPADADVALGSSGIAVFRGYHWEPLGITVAVERGPAESAAGPEDIVVLQPGESRMTAIDLGSPDWFVLNLKNEKGPTPPASITSLNEAVNVWFRLEYVPPTVAEFTGLPPAELIQARSLRSRAFSQLTDLID
jgi:hypothetical protein